MLITNLLKRLLGDVYIIAWVDMTHCLGLFSSKPVIGDDGNAYCSVNDLVYLEHNYTLDGVFELIVHKSITYHKIRAKSKAQAVGKFVRFIEESRAAIKCFTCGL